MCLYFITWARISPQERNECHGTQKTVFHIQISRSTTISHVYTCVCVHAHTYRMSNCQSANRIGQNYLSPLYWYPLEFQTQCTSLELRIHVLPCLDWITMIILVQICLFFFPSAYLDYSISTIFIIYFSLQFYNPWSVSHIILQRTKLNSLSRGIHKSFK